MVLKSVIRIVKLLAKMRLDILKAKKSPTGSTKFAPVLAIRLAFIEIDGYPADVKLNRRIGGNCVFQPLCGLQPVYDTVSPLCLIQRPPKNLSAGQTFAATVIVSNVDHFVRDSRNSACSLPKSRHRKPLTRSSASSLKHSIRLLLKNCFTKTQPHAPSHALPRSNEKLSLADACFGCWCFASTPDCGDRQYSKPPFMPNGGFLLGILVGRVLPCSTVMSDPDWLEAYPPSIWHKIKVPLAQPTDYNIITAWPTSVSAVVRVQRRCELGYSGSD